MAYTPIDKPSDYFETKLYTGDGSTQNITGLDFQPDFTWIKYRNSATYGHDLYDAVRGAKKVLNTNNAVAQYTELDRLTAFTSEGFTLGGSASVNENSGTYVSWNWLANNTTGSTNTAGSINSTVAVNTTSGFSIVSYVGTGSAATVGHGLGVKPDMIFSKAYSTAGDWNVYHDSFATQQRIKLNSTGAVSTNTQIFSSLPTSTLVSIGTSGDINTNGTSHLFYCFNSVQGYSKFGSYTGNGNADGTFIYTGFKPAFVIYKSSTLTENWKIYDSVRQPNNVVNLAIDANVTSAEDAGGGGNDVDFLSNGFKQRGNDSRANGSGQTYIYMAFAENPFVTSTGVPATAR